MVAYKIDIFVEKMHYCISYAADLDWLTVHKALK